MMAEEGFYDSYVRRDGGSDLEPRIIAVAEMIPKTTTSLLDIGCTEGRNLRVFRRRLPNARICGTDLSDAKADEIRAQGFEFRKADASQGLPFETGVLDVVVCGEVIEHVVDPDAMLQEIWRVLKPGGLAVITTPNLAYLPNRILLCLGIQPLFTETSLKQNYGRVLGLLGQGNPAQGHLRIFTVRAMLEVLTANGFRVQHYRGYPWFTTGFMGFIDKVIARKPSLAAGMIVAVAK